MKLTDIAKIRALLAKATPGPWEFDSIHNDGEYGDGPDSHEGFNSHVIFDANGQTIFDSLNSDACEVEVESDEDGFCAWDEVSRRNAELICTLRNAIGPLLDRLEGAAVISRQVPVAWVLDIDIPNYQGASEIRTVVSVHEKPTSWQGKVINEIIKSHPLYAAPQADALKEARELILTMRGMAEFATRNHPEFMSKIDDFLARTK